MESGQYKGARFRNILQRYENYDNFISDTANKQYVVSSGI